MNGVYTLPPGIAFLPSLAKGLKEAYSDRLSDALIFLPTRRAVRALGDAFVELRKAEVVGATLLPRMRPLADIDPDEPPFEPGDLGLDLLPLIPPLQRRFELVKLVQAYHAQMSDLPLSPAGALALVDPLLQILDDTDMEEVGAEGMKALLEIQDMAAQHFQNASIFYKILQDYWPARLKELGYMSPKSRQVALLNTLTQQWTQSPPDHPVIIAGSTGTLKANARLMRCVSQMPEGLIVLPGLDLNLRQSAWDQVDVEHPQGAMKTLIETLGIARDTVRVWPSLSEPDTPQRRARRRLISESLVPASETDDWPNRIQALRQDTETLDPFEQGLDGLSLITAKTPDEEALSIALVMREDLEQSGKSCALVTPDPALARRVRAALRRWGVNVDYSQGEPLEETPLGAFLMTILHLSQTPQNRTLQAAVFKQDLNAMQRDAGAVRSQWNRAERDVYRTPRRSPKLEDVKAAKELEDALMSGLTPLLNDGLQTAELWAKALTQVAEGLAQSTEASGAVRLWREDAGEKAAQILEELMAHGECLGPMSLSEFTNLFATLLRGQVVRPRYGMHPRLQILGPLEARMLSADRIILGGLNEGVWPGASGQTPFLSRLMREKIGLSLPERRYGLAAHDFAELTAHKSVILTRSERSDSGPTVASRWIWRLTTLIRGALGTGVDVALAPKQPYLQWARDLDAVSARDVVSAEAPNPCPPVEKRWPLPRGRQLSVTRIKVWIRDPYSLYCERVLELKALGDLGADQDARDYGNALHQGLEHFVQAEKEGHRVPSAEQLLQQFSQGLADYGYPPHEIAASKSRLDGLAQALQGWRLERRATGYQVMAIEGSGTHYFEAVNFTLTAKADLIEKGPLGYSLIDYKTGAPSSVKVVKAGFDPQLPLTAFMVARGGFKNTKAGPTEELLYVRIKGDRMKDMLKPLTPPTRDAVPAADYAVEAADLLQKLVREFDKPETGYPSQPRAQYTHDYSDYDHVARRKEWARLNSESSEGYT